MKLESIFELSGLFHRFMKLIFCHLDIEAVYGCGLNKTQIKTLFFLENHPGTPMSHISTKMNLEKGSFTSVVDALIEKGFVVRERDKQDRRKVLLSLTGEGKVLIFDLKTKLAIYFEGIIGDLDPEKRDDFENAVSTIRFVLGTLEEKNKHV